MRSQREVLASSLGEGLLQTVTMLGPDLGLSVLQNHEKSVSVYELPCPRSVVFCYCSWTGPRHGLSLRSASGTGTALLRTRLWCRVANTPPLL